MPKTIPPDFPIWLPESDGFVRGRVRETYQARTGGPRAVVRITVGGGSYRKGDITVVPLRMIEPRVIAHRRPTRWERVRDLVKGLFA
jgi:hypothetical protein